MKQTPIHNNYNPDLFNAIPADANRVIEVGCSSGALAKAYRAINPSCEYIGTEIEPQYAEVARLHCNQVIEGDIEKILDEVFSTHAPFDCWVFGDVLEHLYDPWLLLRRIAKESLNSNGVVVACIPNMQHWSMQLRLNRGDLRYQDAGLMDRTHIRWFTRLTILEMFQTSGYRIDAMGGRVFDEPDRERILPMIRSMAKATGADPDQAAIDATPLQWVVKARALSPA